MCLDDQIISTYLDGELKEPWKSQVEEHLSYCPSCRSRFERLGSLREIVKVSELTECEISPRQDRVLAYLEKNTLNKKKKVSFLRKQFKLSVPQVIGVAAAFVVVFVGSWSIYGNSKNNIAGIGLPDNNTSINLENITQVRSSDNGTTSKTLENYSLEDILKNLDARGYDVDIRLKSIQPISFDKIEEETKIVLQLKNGRKVDNKGVATDKDGNILATGVKLSEDKLTVYASDGTVLLHIDPEDIVKL